MKKTFTILFTLTSFFCAAQSKTLVISEVYGGGGSANSAYKNDYIQLFNLSSSPINLAAYTIQLASPSGNVWQTIALSGIVPANHWFLIKGLGDGASGAELPVPDATGNFDLSIAGGKIALVNSGAQPLTSCAAAAEGIVDFIGYGNNVDCSETSAAPAHTLTSATSRLNFAADANNNGSDFAVFPPNPKNTFEIALPITLHAFTVDKADKSNAIHWQVNCLSTSVTFELQRSATLQNFTAIYSSTETKARCAAPFNFKDDSPQPGSNYYRLKIMDIDGNVSYSKISLSVSDINRTNFLKITPNIVSSSAELHYTSQKAASIELHIFDLQG
ncbi:MAG: lamin tail domain-containing protein, partial [Bacteroidota bacterium]|nr:lamin tail domain-containing protein [Bacteroidota bacterium]